MRLLLPPSREGKTSKKKNLKNCLAEIHTLESMADTQKSGKKQICRNPFRQAAPCLFSSVMKGRNVLCPIAKFTKRGHNLFLPKMRRISARQLNHRNDNRKVYPTRKKTNVFFGRTAHFIYLCINNKSCLKRQQIKEVRGI